MLSEAISVIIILTVIAVIVSGTYIVANQLLSASNVIQESSMLYALVWFIDTPSGNYLVVKNVGSIPFKISSIYCKHGIIVNEDRLVNPTNTVVIYLGLNVPEIVQLCSIDGKLCKYVIVRRGQVIRLKLNVVKCIIC